MDQRIYFQWHNLANKIFIAPQNLLISWIDLRADCSMNSAAKLHKCSKFIFRKLKWMEQCEQKFHTTTIEWTFKWPSQRRRKWSVLKMATLSTRGIFFFPTQKNSAWWHGHVAGDTVNKRVSPLAAELFVPWSMVAFTHFFGATFTFWNKTIKREI